jgi:hypothetical protein
MDILQPASRHSLLFLPRVIETAVGLESGTIMDGEYASSLVFVDCRFFLSQIISLVFAILSPDMLTIAQN